MKDKTASLVAMYTSGDQDAGNRLVKLLDNPLRVFLRQRLPSTLVDEVYQETWARFLQQVRTGFEPDDYISWLIGIARLVTLERWREQSKSERHDDADTLEIETGAPPLTHSAYVQQLHHKLVDCLEKLPERYRDFLIGHATDQERATLCTELSVSPANYSKFLFRARQRLLDCINAEDDLRSLQ